MSDDYDDMIQSFIKSAREHVEKYTNLQLMSAKWDLYLDEFPDGNQIIYLEKSPVQTGVVVEYYPDDDTSVYKALDTADYVVDVSNHPARLAPASGKSWPATKSRLSSVHITFNAGYTSSDSVPSPIKSAILLMVANLFENRGDEGHRTMPKTIELLLDPYVNIVFT